MPGWLNSKTLLFVAGGIACGAEAGARGQPGAPTEGVPPMTDTFVDPTAPRPFRPRSARPVDAGDPGAVDFLTAPARISVRPAFASGQGAPPPPDTSTPWMVAGASSIGMALAGAWALFERRRATIVAEELSRIRIHRTSAARVTRPLSQLPTPDELLQAMTAPSDANAMHFGAGPAAARPVMPVADVAAAGKLAREMTPPPRAGSATAPGDAATPRGVREEADAVLAAAQAGLGPLLETVRAVEDVYRSAAFDATIAAAGEHGRFLERLRRRAVSTTANFYTLRDARLGPRSATDLSSELERYWEQVYGCVDEVYELAASLASEEGRRAVEAVEGARPLAAHPDQLLTAAREYLATDDRRLIPIEPFRTDVDLRLHHTIEERHVPGVPAGKVVAVNRCGITQSGRVVRTPEVVRSA